MPRFMRTEGPRVLDRPAPAMDAVVEALRPDHVEVDVYRTYVASCGHCGTTGHYHDEGYLAGFLANHRACEDRYDENGKWVGGRRD